MMRVTSVRTRSDLVGVTQMGTLGAGNHYAEIQVIDKVFDEAAARKMGIDQEGQVRQAISNFNLPVWKQDFSHAGHVLQRG